MYVFRQNSNSFTSGSKTPQKLSIHVDHPLQTSLSLLGFPFDEFVAAWRDDHIRGVPSVDLGLG